MNVVVVAYKKVNQINQTASLLYRINITILSEFLELCVERGIKLSAWEIPNDMQECVCGNRAFPGID